MRALVCLIIKLYYIRTHVVLIGITIWVDTNNASFVLLVECTTDFAANNEQPMKVVIQKSLNRLHPVIIAALGKNSDNRTTLIITLYKKQFVYIILSTQRAAIKAKYELAKHNNFLSELKNESERWTICLYNGSV